MQKFTRVLSKTDFGVSGTASVSNSDFQKIAQLVVPAQQVMTFGANEQVNGGVQGMPTQVDLRDGTNAQIPGVVRFVIVDANEVTKKMVLEERVERLSASAYDRTKAVLMAESIYKAKQDSKLVIEFKPDASATLDWSNSTLIIPTTTYY